VDGVVIVEEDNVLEPLKKLRPDIFYCTKKDFQEGVRKKAEEDLLKSWGGRVVKTGYSSPHIPSSKMVEDVAMLKIKGTLFGKFKRRPLLRLNGDKNILKEVRVDDLTDLGEGLRKQEKTIVFTSLSADLFHVGHARFIQKAKSLGDVLVVGIPSNRSVSALKGPGRPIVDETARALVLAELADVDRVVIFDERTILTCLQKLKPDIFFTVNEDWNAGITNSPEARLIKSIKGKIVISERQAPYLSASKMIDKTAGELILRKFSDLIKTARETAALNADFDPYAPESQLTARERGFYEKVLESVAQTGKCVFCDLKKKYLIKEEDGIVLTVALYPYIDGHLLIIPRRHFSSIKELKPEEWQTIMNLFKEGARVLKEKLGVENVWFLIREGQGIKAGKTVEHLHFHLMPYDLGVIKMGEAKLTITPLEMAQKLMEKKR
jgi:rfaE bifunctional protein nucleotidyltransferase chain/domain